MQQRTVNSLQPPNKNVKYEMNNKPFGRPPDNIQCKKAVSLVTQYFIPSQIGVQMHGVENEKTLASSFMKKKECYINSSLYTKREQSKASMHLPSHKMRCIYRVTTFDITIQKQHCLTSAVTSTARQPSLLRNNRHFLSLDSNTTIIKETSKDDRTFRNMLRYACPLTGIPYKSI